MCLASRLCLYRRALAAAPSLVPGGNCGGGAAGSAALERALLTQQRIQPLGAEGTARRRRTGLITVGLMNGSGLSPVLENAALHTVPAGETPETGLGEWGALTWGLWWGGGWEM